MSSSLGAMKRQDCLGTATQQTSWLQGALMPSKVSGWLLSRSALRTPALRTPLRSRAAAAFLAGAKQNRSVCQTPLPRTCVESLAFCFLAVTSCCRARPARKGKSAEGDPGMTDEYRNQTRSAQGCRCVMRVGGEDSGSARGISGRTAASVSSFAAASCSCPAAAAASQHVCGH